MPKTKRKLLSFNFNRNELMENPEERAAWKEIADDLEKYQETHPRLPVTRHSNGSPNSSF